MFALFLLIILGIDWASGYAIASYCIGNGVDPYGYAFWQSFGPFILLLLIQIIRQDVWLDKTAIRYALLCGIFGIVIPNLLIYFSAQYIPSGILTVLANIAPIFTYPLAIIFGDEKFSLSRIVLVIFGIIGIGLIIIPNQSELTVNFSNSWLYIALLIPFSYAFSAVYISRFYPNNGNALGYAMWMLLIATLCISPLAVIKQGYYPLKIGDINSALILLEIILSTLGYILLFIILKRVKSVYYTLVNAIAAATGIIYGIIIFHQRFSGLTYIAVIIILLTITGLTYTQKKKV